jgi:toxin CcdB
MARFDVRPRRGTKTIYVECQSGFLDHLDTRFVVPLLPRGTAPRPMLQLNPIFVVDNRAMVFFPQFALSVPKGELGRPIDSLAHEQDRTIDALDFLLGGV